jgi:hypothetical protein
MLVQEDQNGLDKKEGCMLLRSLRVFHGGPKGIFWVKKKIRIFSPSEECLNFCVSKTRVWIRR